MLRKLRNKYGSLPVQVRASIWFLFSSFFQKGISVITTPIFTRLLSTEEYGQYSVFDSWLKIITIFVTLQLYLGAYTQGLVKYSDERKIYASSIQGLTLTLCLAWTIIYFIFLDFWNNLFSLTTVQMLSMLVMIWSTSAFYLWAGEQRVVYRYRKLVIATLIVSAAKPIVGIIFVKLATDKVTARILGLALVELVGYTGFFIVQMKRGRKFYSSKYWKHALMFNIPLIPHYLSQSVLNSADRIMIKEMVGASEAGIYSIAYQISQIMTLFNTALSHTLSPWIYQKIKDNRSKDIAKVGYMALGIISLINLAVIIVAPEAVAIFAPKAYHDAIWVIPPVAMSVLFLFSYDLFAKFEFYFEKTKLIALASVLGAVLNIILNYIFIKEYGYFAAGYTTLFCYMTYVLFHYLFMRKICRDELGGQYVYETKILGVIYVGFLVLGFGIMATYNYPYIRYGLILISAVAMIIERKKVKTIIQNILDLKSKKLAL